MIKKSNFIFITLIILLLGCSEYQRVLKSTDLDYKFEKAMEYYEDDEYYKALPLFEELIPLYRGSDRAEIVYYYYCYCNYEQEQLYTAAYHFKKFSNTFPTGKHAEETLFMSAYCHYLLSPVATLEQSSSKKAINGLQLFVNTYPKSELVDSSNVIMDKLRRKLELKSFLNAKQYYKIMEYKAAIIALNNTLKDFPDTERKEEIDFLIFKSHYYLAINSIKQKKIQRFNDSIEAYHKFVDSYPDSKHIKEAENYYKKTIEAKEKFELKNI